MADSNQHVYIHEIVDIIGHNRARYTHHMTANWSPGAQERRGQQCFGVWNVLGSTGTWPKVLNIWEEDGWEGLSKGFEAETIGPGAQDPHLEKWWAAASQFRSGGTDRILAPAPWSPTIADIMAGPLGAVAYAHETIGVAPGAAVEMLETIRSTALAHYGRFGWTLLAAFRTAMRNDDEVVVLWAIPSWAAWAEFEAASTATSPAAGGWRDIRLRDATRFERLLLTDSPLNPTRTGRQPQRSDQRSFD